MSDEIGNVMRQEGYYKPIFEMDANAYQTLKNMDSKFSAFTMDETVANKLNTLGKIQREETENAFWNVYDKFQRLWKVQNTSLIPGFHLRNAMSNTFQSFLNVGAEALNPATHTTAIQGLRGKYVGKDGLSIVIKTGKKSYTLEQIMEQAYKLGVLGQEMFYDDLTNAGGSLGNDLLDYTARFANKKKVRLVDKATGKIDPNIINPLSTVMDIRNPLESITGKNGAKTSNILEQVGGAVGSSIEDEARLANFISNLKQGKIFTNQQKIPSSSSLIMVTYQTLRKLG